MWADLLNGAFSGAQQGWGNVLQQRDKQFGRDQDAIRTQLAQQQEQRQLDEQKRRAVMEAYEQIQGGQKLTAAEAQPYVDKGIKFEKAEDGMLVKPKTSQQILIDNQIDAVNAEKAERDLKLHAFQEMAEPGFWQRPMAERQGLLAPWKIPFQTPEEALRDSERLGVANINAQARVQSAGMPRPQAPPGMDDIRTKAINNVKARFAALAPNEWVKPTAQEFDAAVQAEMALMGGPQTAQPQPAGVTVGTRRTIKGVPAVWDGKGWVAQ